MPAITDVQIANWALSKIPAGAITTRADSSTSAREINTHYDLTLQMCLRRGLTPWNFATKRINITPTVNEPVNEFSKEYDLPGDCMAVQQIYPGIRFRKEGGKLYTNASSLVLKYTSSDVLTQPFLMEMDFMQYFGYALASACAPKLCEDPTRAKYLEDQAEVWFRHAASSMSMEDTPDEMPESPWILAHQGGMSYADRMRCAGFDWDSLNPNA